MYRESQYIFLHLPEIYENPASNKLVYEIQPKIFCLASECTHTIKFVVNMASVGRWKDFMGIN